MLLKLFGSDERTGLRNTHYDTEPSDITLALLQEVFDLYVRGLVHCLQDGKTDGPLAALLGWGDIEPVNIVLSRSGKRLSVLMQLDQIPDSDASSLRPLLS